MGMYEDETGVVDRTIAMGGNRITVKKQDKVKKTEMNQFAKDEFISRIKGMSQEELELIIDIVPIEMCINRISRELEEAKTFKNSIQAAFGNK